METEYVLVVPLTEQKPATGKGNIVKVQRPLSTNERIPQVLIYNEDRSIQSMQPMTEEVRKLFNDDEFKIYYYFQLTGTQITLAGRAPDQDW